MLEFGTDGIRGVANTDLSPEIALGLGVAVAMEFGTETFLIGRDTRVSGGMLSSAFASGLASQGVEVLDLSIFPTGAISFAAAYFNVPAAVISASHNPFDDNGIKIFSAEGRKLTEAAEQRLEHRLIEVTSGKRPERDSSVGVIRRVNVTGEYLDHLVKAADLAGPSELRIVLDTAHGAAHLIARELMDRLGVTVVSHLGGSPNGRNINDGVGSTHLEVIAEEVVATGADFGVAFDGDADRILAVDSQGRTVDGDRLIALFAVEMARRGVLRNNAVAVTVMSNLGLEIALTGAGIAIERTSVGDKYVSERMELHDLSIGGEQSGHIIFADHAVTGDGLLSAAKLISLVSRSKLNFDELVGGVMVALPQVLRSVKVSSPKEVAASELLLRAVAEAEVALGATGRILVRPSGTEPVIRVMVEAPSHEEATSVVDSLCLVIAGLAV